VSAFTDKVQEALSGLLEAEGFDLVLVEFVSRSQILRLFVDKEGGVTLDNCTTVSHLVGDVLDAEVLDDSLKGKYTLEVSSPGLDRPLTRPKDFIRFVGSKAKLTTREPMAGRHKFTGELLSATDLVIQIDVDGEPVEIAYDLIDRARVVPEF
jgi:ribosome maturation factor RimP